jgi:hypothetical protein
MSLKIRDAADHSPVTAIEILSMSSKSGPGRKKYLAKRSRVLASPTHLMEIDLIRTGRRMPMSAPLTGAPYFVVLSRADRRPVADVWPIPLRTPLPKVPIPLLDGDPDVPLDLQAVLDSMYDAFNYALEINDGSPLKTPLPAEDSGWAEAKITRWLETRRAL